MTSSRLSATALAFRPLVLTAAAFALTLTRPVRGQEPQPASLQPLVLASDPSIEYAPDTVLVKLKPGVALASPPVGAAVAGAAAAGVRVAGEAATLSAVLQAFGATAVEPLFTEPLAATDRRLYLPTVTR